MTNPLKQLLSVVSTIIVTSISKIKWKTSRVLTIDQRNMIKQLIATDYYIILTRHNGYLSTYAIGLSDFILTGRWSYYAHSLMNVEDTVTSDDDFRFIEATPSGVHYSGFDDALDDSTGSVVLLRPKNMTIDRWTAVLDKSKQYIGRSYDTLYDLADDNKLSCVELIRASFQGELDYDANFAQFEKMIKSSKNLTPQMFYDCGDFEVAYEFRH